MRAVCSGLLMGGGVILRLLLKCSGKVFIGCTWFEIGSTVTDFCEHGKKKHSVSIKGGTFLD
jgi:hypothetical protein